MEYVEYKSIKQLGKGTYGTVDLVDYKGQKAALKKQRIKDEDSSIMCNNEKLHNRYVIHYYDSFIEPPKNMCILMEYCPNKSLKNLLEHFMDNEQYLSNEGVLKYFCELVIGLQYLHSHNILHRDLKPDNIFITKDNICVLADFGLAKEIDNINALNSTMAGTPLYMAPEVLNNEKYSYKAEIWSLGCILHELCSLHPLYGQAKCQAGLMNLQHTDYNKLRLRYSIPQHIDKKIKDIIRWCLNVNPDKRPTMNDLYNHPVIQKYINETGRLLLFEYDTEADDDIVDKSEELTNVLDELSISLDIMESKSEIIVEILEYYKNEKNIDKQVECQIFKLIQYFSSYIGRTLLRNLHCANPKYKYYQIDTYDNIRKNLKKDFVINIINAIIAFLCKHSFEEEVNAIYEELKNEKTINADIKIYWEQLLQSD